MIDAGKNFVQATYYLEGDGPLVFTCYERLSTLAHAIAIESYPNTETKARQHAGRNMALYNQLVAQAKACINPGFRFYQQKFSVQFHNVVGAFKAARLCCPILVQALHPTAASVQELKQFSFMWKSCQTIWPLLMVQPLKQRKAKYSGGLHMPLLSQIGLLQSKRSCWCSLVQRQLNECLACCKMHLASSKRQH